MFNVFDLVIILFLVLFAFTGYKQGIIKTATNLVGTILVLVISFILKDYLAFLLIKYLPNIPLYAFGINLQVYTILIYQIISFIIISGILLAILNLILRLTGLIDRIVRSTLVLNLPSKIFGGIFGLIEGYLVIFIVLMLFTVPLSRNSYYANSKLKDKMLYKTPIVSKYFGSVSNSIEDISKLIKTMKNDKNIKNNSIKYNLDTLDIMLKYKLISYEDANKLYEEDFFKGLDGVDKIINKYKE